LLVSDFISFSLIIFSLKKSGALDNPLQDHDLHLPSLSLALKQ
jgi:hypothetical protein